MRQRLQEILDDEVPRNPRLNADQLVVGLSLDECVALFYRLARRRPDVPPVQVPQDAALRLPRPAGPPANEQEYWVQLDDPPLVGRIDQVRDQVLVDFKTGEPKEEHAEQLRFYAALWWGRFTVVPRGLELHYEAFRQEITVPDAAELANHLIRYREEIASAEQQLAHPPPPARPSPTVCMYCPVRQLCHVYWTDLSTLPLRRPEVATDLQSQGTPVFRDVHLAGLPPGWRPGHALVGQAESVELGCVQVSVPLAKCPQPHDPVPTGARVLNAMLLAGQTGWIIRIKPTTEVFWESDVSAGR
jgi:hypothetical protein